MIKTHQFTFETFEDSLRNGILAQQTRPVYVFGATEANNSFFLVPVIIAVTSIPTEPDTVGIASVQRTELLCPMSDLKMSWTPLFLDRAQENDLERNITQFYALHCDQRDAVTRYLSEEQSAKFTYCIPYIWTPRIAERELQNSAAFPSEVQIIAEIRNQPIHINFDWTFDELRPFVNELLYVNKHKLEKTLSH